MKLVGIQGAEVRKDPEKCRFDIKPEKHGWQINSYYRFSGIEQCDHVIKLHQQNNSPT